MAAYLRIEQVSKDFGAFRALDGITLDIDEGEFVCFLGPSGCGKTTLLRAIAGLAPQTSGRIFQNGIDISPLEPSQRDFGIVFQSYALFPNLSVRQNVDFGLRSTGRRGAQARRRVEDLLALVGLGDQAEKYPAQLSGGQQQRVALARALAIEPGLLLLDEPLSALDAQVRVRLRNELRDLQRKVGVTTVMVTHDQEEALVIADRIVVMNDGRVEQYGSPRDVYREPATLFVAGFVGEMNFFPGIVGNGGRLTVGGYRLSACRLPEAIAPGSAVTIGIRPEDIQLDGSDRMEGNRMRGMLGEPTFLGAHLRVPVDIDDAPGVRLVVSVPASVVEGWQFVPGVSVSLMLDSERLRVFPGTGTADGVAHV